MPITTLDPMTALVVIDLQKGVVGLFNSVDDLDGVVRNAAALAAAFRRAGKPVVLVNVAAGSPGRTERPRPGGPMAADWTDLIPELDRQPSDILATKKSWGVFATTDLATKLKALGVTEVVVCGVATSIGVESTARQAFEAGFNVALAVDAMTDLSADAHANSLARIFPRLGETGTTAEIVARLTPPLP